MNLIQNAFLNIFENEGACSSEDSECSPKKHLSQGDIIRSSKDFAVFTKLPGMIGYLVISNSCDLINNKLDAILLAVIYSFDIWYDPHSEKELNGLSKELYREANYANKTKFFIPPLEAFGDSRLPPGPARRPHGRAKLSSFAGIVRILTLAISL